MRSLNIQNESVTSPWILLVDDEAFNLEILEELLSDCGYQTETASNGREACEILSAQPEKYAVILLDRMMPEMNGYDVCVVMKADAELNMIPVILLTGVDKAFFQTVYSKHMGMMTEADDYIAKPVEAKELAECVASFLGKD